MWLTVHVVNGQPALGSALQSRQRLRSTRNGPGCALCHLRYATQIAEVDVDDETGEVESARIVASHDCGTPINPMLVEGQVEGGISMGVGFALQEEMLFDSQGPADQPQSHQLHHAHLARHAESRGRHRGQFDRQVHSAPGASRPVWQPQPPS